MKPQITGNYYHKYSWFGLILYVEVKPRHGDSYYRKATQEDLVLLKIK